MLAAAGPGTGKSAFVLNYALKGDLSALYFSADSDAFTQLTRSIAVLTGWTVKASAEAVLTDRLGPVQADLERSRVKFNFAASPSARVFEEELDAWTEVYDEYPEMIIVDNITNVWAEGSAEDDPFSGLESLCEYFHGMARQTGACVVALHHVTGGYNNADQPIPLSGVKGQISRVPELILTMHKRVNEGRPATLCVSTVKNRLGKADPSGHDFAELEFDGDKMSISDIEIWET